MILLDLLTYNATRLEFSLLAWALRLKNVFPQKTGTNGKE